MDEGIDPTIFNPHEDMPTDPLDRRVGSLEDNAQLEVTRYVPQGVNWKMVSERSIDPGHLHTRDGLSGIDIDALESAARRVPDVEILNANFAKSDTAMAVIQGSDTNNRFERTLDSGIEYIFRAFVWVSTDTVAGMNIGLNGTLTPVASRFFWNLKVFSDDSGIKVSTVNGSLGVTNSVVGRTDYYCEIQGSIKVSVTGKLNIEFARVGSSGTANAVGRSFFEIIRTST